ncbi:MAG TPA: hypothetical protein VFY71_10245 [Planctomycetota bacterium]|nr:hypothetical protein [Planctomycetota bacterium]
MRALGLALVSAAVLLLQLVQTRVFSVMLWHHLTYLVVTFTLLGFAAGGTALACRPAWLKGDVGQRLARAALLFGLTVLGAYMVMTRVPPQTGFTSLSIATAAFHYALLLVPMIFGGFVVALALADAGASVGRTYAVNMVGSALGCLLYVPVLRKLGGEGCVELSAAMTLLAAACFAGRRAALPAAAALALAVLAFAEPTALFAVPIAPSKAMVMQLARDDTQRVLLTRWDPICRIDVVGPENPASPDNRTIYQDGDASTVMAVGHYEDETNVLAKEGLPYLLFRNQAPRVLAIGIGGGVDILQAVAKGRPLPPGQRVDFTGVEINATTYGLMTNDYEQLTGDRYHLPGVHVELDEGRSWLRRSDQTYDIIQMTGTDTYAALASGSYVMTESYLYTAEAYDDFLAHLNPDGVISVLRFRFTPPREELRLAGIAVDALRRGGAPSPADHILMIGYDGPNVTLEDGREIGLDYCALLIRKQPFTAEQVGVYTRYCRSNPRTHIMYAPGVPSTGATADFFAAVREGPEALAAFRSHYPYNLAPVTDDDPFFFRYDRWDDAFAKLFGGGLGAHVDDDGPAGRAAAEYKNIVGAEPIGLIMLMTVLGETSLLVALLVLVPLWLFRREGLAVTGAGRWVLYFFGLGAGYILLEVVCMQRFVLFLGNPGYAISVVLLTFLLFSGLGAAVAGRSSDPSRTLQRALPAVVVLIVLLALGLHPLFEATLRYPLAARLAITVAVLAPAAFIMGMPFPSGLRLVSGRAAPLVPWAFGVNGGASVVASVIGILIAMLVGFTTVFVVAAACYAAAFLAGRSARA